MNLLNQSESAEEALSMCFLKQNVQILTPWNDNIAIVLIAETWWKEGIKSMGY